MPALLTVSEHRAHTRLPYTQIYSIYDLYINIYTHTHTYISVACTCRPRSLGLAQLWETRKSPGRTSGQLYWEQGESLQQHERAGPGGRVGVTQLAPHNSVPCNLPLSPQKREHLVCQVSGRAPVIPKLGTQRKDNLCKSEVRWSTLGLHGGEFPVRWGRPRETPCQTKQDAKIWSPSPPLPKSLPD